MENAVKCGFKGRLFVKKKEIHKFKYIDFWITANRYSISYGIDNHGGFDPKTEIVEVLEHELYKELEKITGNKIKYYIPSEILSDMIEEL